MKKIITLLFILTLLIQIRITAQYVTVPTDTIVLGSSATLTPVSDSTILSYSWSTGATTQSIQVSPTVTTKYYVTAYGNSFSETDEGIVLVAQTRTINACASTSSITLAGDTGSSCYFDGENNGNWIFIETDSNGLSIQDSMSLEMWVYPTEFAPDNQYSTLFHKAFGGEGVLIMKDDGQLAFFYGNGVTPNDTPYYTKPLSIC
ncbi:MAG: hypothetical protein A2X12_05295 [Bacteroidetes bacterium GWE2_29_8]|nr:MAG: hypothetical protein A2X12_05295 [Bacteroidetes bacterium GWE2_29_8]OFY14781.1 MAG: hypothetical protein A2X02_04545 [Bacteroidetes bacterium GWF2_29_10]